MAKLWLISQEVNNGWDTYDSAVVCAETPEEAQNIYPGGPEDPEWRNRDWADPKDVKVQYLGEASTMVNVGVVCSSYNAG